MKFAVRYRDDDLAAHYLAFHVAVGVVLITVVGILRVGFFGSEFFEPFFIIAVQAGFVVVYKYRSGNVHRVYKT